MIEQIAAELTGAGVAIAEQAAYLASDPQLIEVGLVAGGYGAYRKYRG